MKKKVLGAIIVLCVLVGALCYYQRDAVVRTTCLVRKPNCVVIQPLGDFDLLLAENVRTQLQVKIPNVIIVPSIPFPRSAYVPARDRYRADKLINHLGKIYGMDTTVVGLSNYDISTTKGKVADWGVMGLGFRPGNACVISTFRLKKANLKSQFYKVAIHELGHTQGLPHCSNQTCYMRDAEGGNPTDDEKGFCKSCQKFLNLKGWK